MEGRFAFSAERHKLVDMSDKNISPDSCQTRPEFPSSARTVRSPAASSVPVIPLMSKEEGERLISQMPQRTLKEALELKERMLGRL